jgi:hypothetical protein
MPSFSWIRPKPVEQSTGEHSPVEDGPTINETYFQTRGQSGNDMGAVEPVFYIVVDDMVKLCDEHGRLTGKNCKLEPGDDAKRVASRLGRQAWSARGGESDFNRQLPVHDTGWR